MVERVRCGSLARVNNVIRARNGQASCGSMGQVAKQKGSLPLPGPWGGPGVESGKQTNYLVEVLSVSVWLVW